MAKSSRALRKQFPKGQAILDGVFDPDELREIRDAQDDVAFESVDMSIETDHRCPSCGYEWSGNPKPASAKVTK